MSAEPVHSEEYVEPTPWFVFKNDKQLGPIPEPDLASLVRQGKLPPETLVWSEGMTDWSPISNVETFKPSLELVNPPVQFQSAQPSVQSPSAVASATSGGETTTRPVLEAGFAEEPHPWIRYWARYVDMNVMSLIVGVLLAASPPAAALALSFLSILAYPFVEALMFAMFGSTPGKWLMGIRVVRADGEQLTFIDGLKRTTGVVIKGLGLWLPIVSMITHIMAYNRLNNTGSTSWDEDGGFRVLHKPVGTLRILGLIGVLFGLMGLAVLVGVMQAFSEMQQMGGNPGF